LLELAPTAPAADPVADEPVPKAASRGVGGRPASVGAADAVIGLNRKGVFDPGTPRPETVEEDDPIRFGLRDAEAEPPDTPALDWSACDSVS
jgi:hypothetical protein